MTREETISILEESKRQNEIMRDNPSTFWASHQMADGVKNAKRRIEALDVALSALRPISREQVWRGEWITKHYVDGILEGTNFDECSKCGYQRVFENPELKTKYIFCPACGAPMTGEAVDIIMRRLETLYETT